MRWHFKQAEVDYDTTLAYYVTSVTKLTPTPRLHIQAVFRGDSGYYLAQKSGVLGKFERDKVNSRRLFSGVVPVVLDLPGPGFGSLAPKRPNA